MLISGHDVLFPKKFPGDEKTIYLGCIFVSESEPVKIEGDMGE